MKVNITNIQPQYSYADPDQFFMRREDKYGLTEVNVEKIDMGVTLDYELAMIPPLLVDKGSLEFSCQDLSLNSVFKLQLNQTKLFFDVIISHLLIQINPQKFNLNLKSYSDLTIFANKQTDLIIKYVLNDILSYSRYGLAKDVQKLINDNIGIDKKYIAIDQYLPYTLLEKEPANFYIALSSDRTPVNLDTYISLFINVTLFQYHGDPSNTKAIDRHLQSLKLLEPTTVIPSFTANGEQLQIHIQDNTVNQILKAVYDAGLMSFTLKKITPESIQNDFFLLIFL